MPEDHVESTGLHYRPGTHAKGEETMRRILEAAIEVFAAEGYDGASTRALAERAKVNLPAIQYYFGSKEGLYRAAIGQIVGVIELHLAPAASRIEKAIAGKRDPEALFGALYELLDAFTALVTSPHTTASRSTFISRAEIEGKPALDLLHESVTRFGVRPCMQVIARLLRRRPEDEEILVRTLAILGQIFVFHSKCNNKSARQTMHWDQLDDRKVRLIQTLVREQTTAILRAAMGEAA
jgi:TetR/AcrR family transcriptional regulator, regulator of cefoperazone and chloramphenicol sensitivity